MIVFWRYEYEGIKRRDLTPPRKCMRLAVLIQPWRERLVQMGKIIRRDIDKFERSVAASASDLEHPSSDSLSTAPGASASDDHADAKH